MRSAKNLHPEWGHGSARRIDFMRAMSIFLVATTIGATAGGGVVLSLVDVPTGEASVGAHTLVAPVQALISAAVRALDSVHQGFQPIIVAPATAPKPAISIAERWRQMRDTHVLCLMELRRKPRPRCVART
jgi:hypothetical protein